MSAATHGSEASEQTAERGRAAFMRPAAAGDPGRSAAVISGLIGARLGRPFGRCDPGEVLALARDEDLPLLAVAETVGVGVPPAWEELISAEAAARDEHEVTGEMARRAIGSLAGCCAWSQPRWRRGAGGQSVELLVPRWAFGEVAARLAGAGLVHLSRLDAAATAVLVRTDGGSVADLVVLEELAPGERAHPGGEGSTGFGELAPSAARARVVERVRRAGRARLVDLADLELVAGTEGGGGASAAAQAAAGAVAGAKGRRGGPAAGLRRERIQLGQPAVVAFSGPEGACRPLAEELAASLRRAGVFSRVFDVHDPDPARAARLARDAARARGDGVAVLVGGGDGRRPARRARRRRFAPDRLAGPVRAPTAAVTVTVLHREPEAGSRRGGGPAGLCPPWLVEAGVPVVVPPGREAGREILLAVLRRLLVREETVGRHPGLWRVLLPLVARGSVVVAGLGRVRTENLQHTYPEAVSLATDIHDLREARRGVVWDGSRPPLRPASVGLVVVDDRDGLTLGALEGSRRAGGASASLVRADRRFDYVVYPHADYPLLVTRQEWPTWAAGSSIRLRLARFRVRTPLWRLTRRDGLRVDAAGTSLATRVLGDVADRAGEPAALQGVLVGRGRGQMTLRARLGVTEVAVRLGLTARGVERLRSHEAAERRLQGKEERLGFSVPKVLLTGRVEGVEWVAEEWLAGRSGPGGREWAPGGGWGWDLTRRAALRLAGELPTGQVGDGWAARWAAPLFAVAPGQADELLEVLQPVERSGMRTSWAHGDLWPGNVFLRGRGEPPLVIDWDRARDDAPSGLDAVFLEIVRVSLAREVTVGAATAALMLSAPSTLEQVAVGGRPWAGWPARVRRGLLVAAFLRTASGGSVDRPTWSELWVEENLRPVLAASRLARIDTG